MGITESLLVCIQARIGGTRFPGKVLAPLLGQPMLLYQLDRISRLSTPHTLVVACQNTPGNEAIQRLCAKHGYRCCLYDAQDVLLRYVLAAEEFGATEIVRLTADCPLVDHAVIEQLVAYHRQQKIRPDHTGIAAEWPDGQDMEIVSYQALDVAEEEAVLPSDREHVTPFLWRQPQRFRCVTFPCPFNLSWQQYSVDTPEDLAMVEQILALSIEGRPGWRDIWRTIRDDHALMAWQQRRTRNLAYTTQIAHEQQRDEVPTWEHVRYG